MPATVKDIAKELNLSTSTVCYALNGGPRTVTETVRTRVLAKARELNYRPNRVARSLAKGSTQTIGVVPPSVEVNVFLSQFVQQVWNAIVNEAEILGQDIMLFAGRNLNAPDEPGLGLLDGRVDGVVFIAPRLNARAMGLLAEHGLPFTSISSNNEAPGVHMTVDNKRGVKEAVRHLAEIGHRRIAHLAGSPFSPDAESRLHWFCDTMGELELPLADGFVEQGEFTRVFGYEATHRLLKLRNPPTAIFAANDEIALGACTAALEIGLEIPRDLSVIGFDDIEMASLFSPSLTTVRQPIQEMASAAVRGVVELSKGSTDVRSTCFPTRLVTRASTARPPVGASP